MKIQIQNLLPLIESTSRVRKLRNTGSHQNGSYKPQFQNQGMRKKLFQLRNRLYAGR